MPTVRVKKLDGAALLPVYSSPGAAGADLYALPGTRCAIPPGEVAKVRTGLAAEIPEGYAGLVYARSGLAVKSGLAPANCVGVIDSDYRGEIIVALRNSSPVTATVSGGDRVAQLVVTPYLKVNFEESGELPPTERGEGGFGSTGA